MNLRTAGIVLAIAALFGGAIWLASGYESGSFGKSKPKPDVGLIVDLKSQEQPDYVVVCNEGEFQDAFERFRNYVKVSTDALKAPGGPMVISLADVEVPMDLQRPQRVVIEVLKRHSPKRVVLMAHEECLIDDSIGAWLDDPAGVRQRQYAQLARARTAIHTWLPKSTVEIYYGERYGTNQMRFFPVSDDSLLTAVDAVAMQADSLRY